MLGLFLLAGCADNVTPTPVPAGSSPTLTSNTPISNPTLPVPSISAVAPNGGIAASETPGRTAALNPSKAVPPLTSSPQILATGNLSTTPGQVISSAGSPTPAASSAPLRAFDRVFIIVLENADYSRAVAQPYLAGLANQGTFLTNFYGVAHPSYPNYLAMVAGSTFGILDDGQTDLAKTNLVDLLEAKGISWKSYAQQYPVNAGCFKGIIQGNYVRKHLPFLSFTNIQNDSARCSKIVPAEQLDRDLAAGTLPQYSMYIPDQNNDGHDTGVGFAAKWLQGFLTPLLKNPAFFRNTLVVVTFDEGDNGTANQIYTLLLGDPVKVGLRSNSRYNHYSLLRTIEDNFGLGTLGREDASAFPITGVWNTPAR